MASAAPAPEAPATQSPGAATPSPATKLREFRPLTQFCNGIQYREESRVHIVSDITVPSHRYLGWDDVEAKHASDL
ncbi:hypothetical protein HBI27_045300 [Parastagonospora nodorum]|nr:hypothetical protein HBI27_045300 [Parastagonospora nodorum]